jgi:BirA family transcriptional regulator, biotin operon repressor / biotin---[acetyl-CoA-carboxylase] ligase
MQDRLIIYPEAESTQDLAKAAAVNDGTDGMAIMALKQTKGRGRLGHQWVSPPGKNLAISLVLRPAISPQELPLLGLLAAVAVAETVESAGVTEAQLKWPNDVLVKGRKIAGILPEAAVQGDAAKFLVIGVGLNVNVQEDDFPGELQDTLTSLKMCTAKEWDLVEVAQELMRCMDELYARVHKEGCGFIPDLWATRWAHRGKPLVRDGVTGIGEGIDRDGALLLRTDDGSVVRITSGMVDLSPEARSAIAVPK